MCWRSMIQFTVTMSTTEAEYMVAAKAAKEALWLTGSQVFSKLKFHCIVTVIYLAKNQVYHARTKHTDVRFHKIRKLVASSELLLEKIHTSENAVDMLTKPITTDKSSIAWT